MPTRRLLIGDVHSVVSELDDCRALAGLILETVKIYHIDEVIFTGDLGHNHDILNLYVIKFWEDFLRELAKKIALIGNHDQAFAGSDVHGLGIYKDLRVVSQPTILEPNELVSLPYIHDNAEFVSKANSLYAGNPKATLLCHATFDGSTYENGFYAQNGVDQNLVKFKRIISGHIHSPQTIGKVEYIGAPRWRTVGDANIDRSIWVLNGVQIEEKIDTGSVCRRIWVFKDSAESPLDLNSADWAPKDLNIVDIYGSAERIKERDLYFRAKGFRPRLHRDKEKRIEIRESEGVANSFMKYCKAYRPAKGTPIKKLGAMVAERIKL